MNFKWVNKILEKKYLQIINLFLSMMAIYYLFNLFSELEIKVELKYIKNFVYVFPLFFLANFLIAKGLSELSNESEKKIIVDAWFRSVLGKYIPFKIGIPLLRFGNIKRNSNSYSSKKIFKDLIFEQSIIVLSTLTLGSLYFFNNEFYQLLTILIIFIISLITILFNKQNKNLLIISYIFVAESFMVLGFLSFTALSFKTLNLEFVLGFIFSASLSLLFIGAPAGIGIREYIGISLLTLDYELNFVLELLLLFRLLIVFTDLFSYIFYVLFKKIKQ